LEFATIIMISIDAHNRFHLKLIGYPKTKLRIPSPFDTVGLLPAKIPFVKPKLRVKKGDRVRIGSVLFTDKRDPRLQFCSPGGGRVTTIRLGPRRVVEEIVIHLDPEEKLEATARMDDEKLAAMEREELVEHLLDAGLWPFLRALPFRDIPSPDKAPPFILVNLNCQEPYQPHPELYLEGQAAAFRFGIKILDRLSNGRVRIYTSSDRKPTAFSFDPGITHMVEGGYPADDPGVILYHTRIESKDNRTWFIQGQDLLLLARSLRSGHYETQRIVTAAGPAAVEACHLNTRLGAPLSSIVSPRPGMEATTRCIAGGLFTGYALPISSYLGLYETSVALVSGGEESEFFGFARPGYKKPSYSRAFLSAVNRNALAPDTGLHGETRACVNCSTCAKVCPVEILPQFTYKSLLADDVEEALAHGLLDCAECGLCTFVCPSKIELSSELKKGKADYYKEMYGSSPEAAG